MNTSGMIILVIIIYKRYGVGYGTVTIEIISINKNNTLQIVLQCGTIQRCGTE